MKKQLLLITIATAFLATSNFLVGLTVEIDRAYAKDLTTTDIPYYTSYNGGRISEQYGRSEISYRMYEELRLPIQVFALYQNPTKSSLEIAGRKMRANQGLRPITKSIEMTKDSFDLVSKKEIYSLKNSFITDFKFIQITIGNVFIKEIPITPATEKITLSLEKNDLKDIHLVQGLNIFNEIMGEPLKVSYYYNNMLPHFFGAPEYVAPQTPRNTRHILLNSLEKVTISYLTGKVIKTFTKKELEILTPEKKRLNIKNFLPLNLTIDNQSSSPLTLQKTLENYSVSSYLKPGPIESNLKNFLNKSEKEIKGTISVKQDTSTIDAKKKETYTFSSNVSSKELNEFSVDLQKIISFDVKTIDTIQEISVFSNSSDYCSTERFSLDLQDTTNPLLATKEYNDRRPFALTLTVNDAPEDENDDAFGSSCKKLVYSVTVGTPPPTTTKK